MSDLNIHNNEHITNDKDTPTSGTASLSKLSNEPQNMKNSFIRYNPQVRPDVETQPIYMKHRYSPTGNNGYYSRPDQC